MEFKEIKFDITSNISLIVSLAYYEGHPIVETKKTKINYKGTILEVNRENKNNETLMNKLISKSLYSIFSIELVNYLNRLINGDNLYEVYIDNSNKEDKPEELIDYVFKPEKACSSTGARDESFKYIDNLMNKDHNIDLDLLDQHRNPKYPTCVHNFEEMDYIPIYTYIHPRLAKNQGNTIHIMHLGLLFQLLTRIKGLPEFNTQASISALNTAMRANQIGITMETVNKTRYDDLVKENKRLLEDNLKKQDKIDELKSTVERIERQNNQLLQKNNEQSSEINELKETIDELYNMNLSSGVTIRSMDKKLTDVRTAVEEVHNEVSTIRVKDKKLHRTRDVLILYTSPDKPRDQRLRDEAPEGYTWIGTYNGQPRNFNASVPRNRIVIFQSESNRLDTFKDILVKVNISRYIHKISQYRDILVRDDQIELLFQAITEELNRDDTFDSVANLEETLTTNNANDTEIRLKQQLLQQHSPLLINLNRYKRRIYIKINDELVLVDTVNNAYNYDWIYRYGPSGTKYGKLDLEILRTSRFTSELETRINYE